MLGHPGRCSKQAPVRPACQQCMLAASCGTAGQVRKSSPSVRGNWIGPWSPTGRPGVGLRRRAGTQRAAGPRHEGHGIGDHAGDRQESAICSGGYSAAECAFRFSCGRQAWGYTVAERVPGTTWRHLRAAAAQALPAEVQWGRPPAAEMCACGQRLIPRPAARGGLMADSSCLAIRADAGLMDLAHAQRVWTALKTTM
jgi:hypothetical protein